MTGATASVDLLPSVSRLLKDIGHVVVGNPENRRVRFFQEALCQSKLPRAVEVSYAQIVSFNLQRPDAQDQHPLAKALAQAIERYSRVLLRIESAGESFEVDRLMIALGASELPATDTCQSISVGGALRLRYDHGRLRYLRQYFAGLESTLRQIHRLVTFDNSVTTYNSVPEILIACDKIKCSQWLRANSVAVARVLPSIASYDELSDHMRDAGWQRTFVKHSHGSSAAGIIALDASGFRTRATTTMEMAGSGSKTRFYNNLKLRTYQKVGDIRKLINFLCREGVHVEQWLPRACTDGRVFDLRIVAINGRSNHVVVRTSRSPITNLHLGNQRGDLAALQRAMGDRRWQRTVAVAEHAAACFSNSHYLGIDLLLQPGFRSPTVLEVNAFGDLLPGVLHQGKSTYATEIQQIIKRL